MAGRYKAAGIGGAALLAVILLQHSLSGTVSSGEKQSGDNRVVRPVPTAIVAECPRRVSREFPGKVRANRRVELAFNLGGQLVELNAREGSIAAKDNVLARLDSRDYQNALDAAKANFNDASRDFNRAKQLRKQKVIAESEYDKALTAWEIAQADLRLREKALADTTIVAPFDGVIAARCVENHERVDAGQEIISFQDISRVEVVIQVPERLIAQGGIEALHDLNVHFDADGGRWFEAKAEEYRIQPDVATRTYDVIVALAPPKDIKVLPGMTATVKAEIDNTDTGAVDPSRPNLTRIPPEAIWTDGLGASYVWVVPEQGGEPKQTRVEIGPLQNGQVVILAGLNPGQHIAMAGIHALREGIRVRPRIAGKEGLEG